MLEVTPQERLALGVTALLLAAGTGARVLADRAPGGDRLAAEAGLAGAAPMEAALARAEDDRIRTRPLREGERIDPNTASALELQRLPRVGPALAGRIVAHREASGDFRTLADLDAVPGVGPAMLAGLAPLVTLPPAPPPVAVAQSDARAGAGGAAAAVQGSSAGGQAGGEPIAVNRASAAELEQLPGIGPAIAGRIVEFRARNGPFRTPADLEKVPGIGPGLRERLEPRIRLDP